jgi:hypothetical protein
VLARVGIALIDVVLAADAIVARRASAGISVQRVVAHAAVATRILRAVINIVLAGVAVVALRASAGKAVELVVAQAAVLTGIRAAVVAVEFAEITGVPGRALAAEAVGGGHARATVLARVAAAGVLLAQVTAEAGLAGANRFAILNAASSVVLAGVRRAAVDFVLAGGAALAVQGGLAVVAQAELFTDTTDRVAGGARIRSRIRVVDISGMVHTAGD